MEEIYPLSAFHESMLLQFQIGSIQDIIVIQFHRIRWNSF